MVNDLLTEFQDGG